MQRTQSNSINLCSSNWEFRQIGKEDWAPASVPGTLHEDLRRAGKTPDPFWADNEKQYAWIEQESWEYRTRFNCDKALLENTSIELLFEGLDTLATITLNGEEIGESRNMFTPLAIDVRTKLKEGDNELNVRFPGFWPYLKGREKFHRGTEWCDPVGGSSNIRKQASSFGWDWAPRLPSCGIWLPVYLHAWSGNRIKDIHLTQKHENGHVLLECHSTLVNESPATLSYKLFDPEGELIEVSENGRFEIAQPKLWWPAGHGEQPLYRVEVELSKSEQILDTKELCIGLRTIELDRHQDEYGESFQFVVNGKPIFAKGANWIPAHSYPTSVQDSDYRDLLTAAVSGNMNMLRVWGGGIYESEFFYDLCDELGLLVWQDFMFACSTYPGDSEFLDLAQKEADHQVKRLANRTCLALWCGNNELEQKVEDLVATKATKEAYETLFYDILPKAVEEWDGATTYWPSSPHNPEGYEKGFNNPKAGDAHYWGVWHGGRPVKNYEKQTFRFCSEFGMQSYPSKETALTFCREENLNIFAPELETHQKHPAGNGIILDYISKRYRFPKDYEGLAYLSQLNQAYTLKVGVEHFRRLSPCCMGAIYWQLNDCWPAVSWSSIEYGGRWKALHHEARRFFAPLLVTAQVHGDIERTKSNGLVNTHEGADIHLIYDGQEDDTDVIASYCLMDTHTGEIYQEESQMHKLQYGMNDIIWKLSVKQLLDRVGAENVVLKMLVTSNDRQRILALNTALFTAPRLMSFDKSPIELTQKPGSDGTMEITLQASEYKHCVSLSSTEATWHFSDNYFDLLPGEAYTVTAKCTGEITNPVFRTYSYDDTY